VVGIFPTTPASYASSPRSPSETHDEWQVAERSYLSEGSMAKLTTTDQTEPQQALEAPIAVTA
jgi:putative transposase